MITFTWPRYGENMLIKTGVNKFQNRVGKVGKIAQIGTRCCQHLDVRQDNVPWTPSPEEVRSSADRSFFQWEIGNESHAMVARRMWPVLKASLTFVRKASFAQVLSSGMVSDLNYLCKCLQRLKKSGYAVGFLKFWSEVGELLQHALFSGGEILPPDYDQRGQGQHKGCHWVLCRSWVLLHFHRAMRTVMRRSFWILCTFAKMFCPKNCQVDELSPTL